jgi:splicing factor U2AF subunit
MALDTIMFEGVSVRIRRPNDYNAAAAVGLGPSMPNPSLNLAAIGLSGPSGGGGGGGTGGGAGERAAPDPERIFVGGLPYYLTEEQCKELLGSFGAIKSFDLVKDRDTGTSKG